MVCPYKAPEQHRQPPTTGLQFARVGQFRNAADIANELLAGLRRTKLQGSRIVRKRAVGTGKIGEMK